MFLLVISFVFLLSCDIQNINRCMTCHIYVYSRSNAMTPRNVDKVLCTQEELAEYPEGLRSCAAVCPDCLQRITCEPYDD